MSDELEPIYGDLVSEDLPSNDEMAVALRRPDSLQTGPAVSAPMVATGGSVLAPLVDRLFSGSMEMTPENLKSVMDMQKSWEDEQARKAYYADMSKARGELPMVAKNRSNNHLNSQYADLDSMIAVAGPVLGKNNLSFNFVYDQSIPEQVTTSCVTSHSMGHTELVKVTMPVMTPIVSRSGNQATNPAQMVGIAMTYGRRYAFAAALGIATGDDTDGNVPIEQAQEPAPKAAPVTMIDASDMVNLKAVIEETGRSKESALSYLVGKYGGTFELVSIPKADLKPLYKQLRKSSE